MSNKLKKRRSCYRVFANDEGRVYLELEPDGIRVPIERPITTDKLDEAKRKAIKAGSQRKAVAAAERLKMIDPSRAQAQQEIEAALHPIRKGPWLTRLSYAINYVLFRLFAAFLYLLAIVAAYKFIQHSSENFPEWLHAIILTVYVLGLAALLYRIGTEANRLKHRKFVLVYFGIWGMFVLPCFLLVTSGVVLASITFRLYNQGLITLDTCAGRAVSEAGLLDFYMWHFVNIIPTLQVTKLWRWGEPYCYSQSRVGLLIFAFQLFVVIPSFNTIRFYWKHRHRPGYVYDPNWNPKLL